MDYAGFLTDITTWAEISPSDPNLLAALPTIIEMAEKRCYRDLDLLTAMVTDTSSSTTPNTRVFPLPTSKGRFIDLDVVAVNGVPCAFCSVATIASLWPTDLVTGAPALYARTDDTTLLLAPPSGSALPVMIRGSARPIALSASNTSTWLTLYAYDLFYKAAMVELTGYLRDWGAQSDDPKFAISWEDAYSKALPGAQAEEIRKRL